MAKIAQTDRQQYLEKSKPYNETIKGLLKGEADSLVALRKDSADAGLKRLGLADDMINLASNYIVLNGISLSMIKLKNEEALNEARKSLYKAVIYLEEVVSNLVDAPYSDYEEKLEKIASVDAAQRYLLVRKLGLGIQLLENAYGDNTKWRWAFVELEARYAATVKNIFDLKNAVTNTDPRSPYYEPVMRHHRLLVKLMMQAASRYRDKYELSTNRIDDFKMGIKFLSSLRRIHMVLGNRNEADVVKKKLDIWSNKLEVDSKKLEEASKNSAGSENGK